MNLQQTTELEAINFMLQMAGEQPVNIIPIQGFNEASIAQSTLHNVSRAIQNEGLNCNTEDNYTLPLTSTGEVIVPTNVLNVDFDNGDYVIRGNKVYNKAEHTFIFNKSLTCDITWFLDYADLPNHVRNYVMIKAARKFLLELVGATDVYKLAEQQEYDALTVFKRYEINNSNQNFRNGYDVAKILARRG